MKNLIDYRLIRWKKVGPYLFASYYKDTEYGPVDIKARIRLDVIFNMIKNHPIMKRRAEVVGWVPLVLAVAQNKTVQNLAKQGVQAGAKATGLDKNRHYKAAGRIFQKAKSGDQKAQKRMDRVAIRAAHGDKRAAIQSQLIYQASRQENTVNESPKETKSVEKQSSYHRGYFL